MFARPQQYRIGACLMLLASAAGLHADSKKLTEDQRIELLRGLTAEYAKVKVLLPKSKKPLEVTVEGSWDQSKWKAAETEFGVAARVKDLIQVTQVSIEKNRIVLELNGGARLKTKWYEHVEIGVGNRTTPISQGRTNAPGGTTISLEYGGLIGETNSAEVKQLLRSVLDFEKESVTENYLENLPEPIKAAIKAQKAVEGMNRDQVIMAVGRPVHKSRETKEGLEYEDWIYGEPPGRVTFVTFTGDKVVKVKETYAGLGGSIAQMPGPQ